METCEKNNPLNKEGTEPSDEDFKLLIKELLYYNEALKYQFYQIDNSSPSVK
jgi:hypothetical protein